MADIRSTALAVDSYIADFSFAPSPGEGTAARLLASITPTYMRKLPLLDAWSTPILYSAEGTFYTIQSYGADSILQNPLVFGPTTRFEADIVLSNGMFVQWPEGLQTR